jgi:hypothetical protein
MTGSLSGSVISGNGTTILAGGGVFPWIVTLSKQ